MKILFISSAFNGLTQRAWLELDRLNHQVKVHIAVDDSAMKTCVEAFCPDLIIAPFLKKRIPEDIWKKYVCLIIHPGMPGDRGASSLDWAILNRVEKWGVTILQAVEKMDSGPIWGFQTFGMRQVSKACLYRHEVTQAAIKALLVAVRDFEVNRAVPISLVKAQGTWNRRTRQKDFQFSWNDNTLDIITKINAADSDPGVIADIAGSQYYAYGAHVETKIQGKAGHILCVRDRAICIGTGDGALWLSHLKKTSGDAVKLPATILLGPKIQGVSIAQLSPFGKYDGKTFREIRYEEEGQIGYLHFDFYNGAMDTDQCKRLLHAIQMAKTRPIKILVLMGGHDIWSNGIHLNVIEHADNPADESWSNINAIDDVILEIINTPNQYVVCALQGNAGAGGVALSLAGDKVICRRGIVLNPHTRNMGLYGSEYWTYLLPKRIGTLKANDFTEQCLPWGTDVAKEIGLVDDVFGEDIEEFNVLLKQSVEAVIKLPYFEKLLKAKVFQRRKDERIKPLAQYREEELKQMKDNFYNDNWGYSKKRFQFVHKIVDDQIGQSIGDRDWYSSRRKIYRKRKWESIEYS